MLGRWPRRGATAYFSRGAGGQATAARGPNEQLLDRENRAVHVQFRCPGPPEDGRLGRGQEQSGPEAPAADEARGPAAGLSYGRRESRRGRGRGDIRVLSGPQAEGSQAGGGRPSGSGETAAARPARRD